METTYRQTCELMEALWPKWRMEPELKNVLHERWSQLHQDKLQDCIRTHRLEREMTPDISAIHKAYCRITEGTSYRPNEQTEAVRTRRYIEELRGPSDAEMEAWDREAERILATATPEEIARCRDRLGIDPDSPRLIASMVAYCREHPHPPAVWRA